MPVTRRTFLRRASMIPAALSLEGRCVAAGKDAAPLRFGVITDVHQDVMHDGVGRVRAFAAAMTRARADFVIQLGDFCVPHERNRPFLEAWNTFEGAKYHVLGNHDVDGGFKAEQALAYWGLREPYYTFDRGPVRAIVLNGNERGGKAGGYPRFIGETQLAWLERQLARAGRPVMVFVHQPFDDTDCIENSAAVRAVLERAERESPGRVLCVFSGHHHQDYQCVINGIPYLQINSASYLWLGSKLARETYPPDVHRAHEHMKYVAAYRDPLWAVVTLDPAAATLTVQGRASRWVGPDPWERGADEKDRPRARIAPGISDRTVKLAQAQA